ncbi:F-box protein [Acorus calamus]|uniref:F-box protein n=1 Tax=Acorus calamus TaxID=4465 RepID=A0AAV9DRS1_ACOCL|nr:F-box protein [Acorus calamus]
MGLKIGGNIERVNGKELSYGDFVNRYLKKNEPVLLTGLMEGWRSCRDWVTHDGLPNLHFFSTHFGKSKVQVADCGTREFTDQKRVEMSVSEFVSHWMELSSGEHSNGFCCNVKEQRLLYLKDWHFVKEYPDYVAYTTPPFFTDDWLNLYLDSHHMHYDPQSNFEESEINCSDYRFVYMGAKGTWTPLHADVFRSYSWSANVCGRKRWHFLSPSQSNLIFDRNLKNSVYDIFGDVPEKQFPGFKEAINPSSLMRFFVSIFFLLMLVAHCVQTIWLECTQERNEIIFVPSGWYHQVLNMEDTISINHNWFNGYNLSWVWNLLVKDYNEARGYIDDIRDISDDFEGLCQRNLAANTGMNFFDFFTFITRMFLSNLTQLYHHIKKLECPVPLSSTRGRHHIDNLISIHKVVLDMKSVEAFSKDDSGKVLNPNYNIKEFSESPEFAELCGAIDRAYTLTDEQCLFSRICECVNPICESGLYAMFEIFGDEMCSSIYLFLQGCSIKKNFD